MISHNKYLINEKHWRSGFHPLIKRFYSFILFTLSTIFFFTALLLIIILTILAINHQGFDLLNFIVLILTMAFSFFGVFYLFPYRLNFIQMTDDSLTFNYNSAAGLFPDKVTINYNEITGIEFNKKYNILEISTKNGEYSCILSAFKNNIVSQVIDQLKYKLSIQINITERTENRYGK